MEESKFSSLHERFSSKFVDNLGTRPQKVTYAYMNTQSVF
jgi:hypothetical protein